MRTKWRHVAFRLVQNKRVIFLPAIDWLVIGAMGVTTIFFIIITLLVFPPTAVVNKWQGKDSDDKE